MVARELDEFSERLEPRDRVIAAICRHLMAIYQGDMGRGRSELLTLEAAVDDAPIALGRFLSLLYAAKMHRFEGRLEDAERTNDEALAFGLARGIGDAGTLWMSVDIGISRDVGRVVERADLYQQHVASMGGTPPGSIMDSIMSSIGAVLHADAGLRDQAERELDAQLAADFPLARARNTAWLVCATYLADTAAALQRVDAAALLYDLLLPYEGRIVATPRQWTDSPMSHSVDSPPCCAATTPQPRTSPLRRGYTSKPIPRSFLRARWPTRRPSSSHPAGAQPAPASSSTAHSALRGPTRRPAFSATRNELSDKP